ncbi:MAG: ROK family protein [Lachnospiraceae bacterium]|nr:ROK family protein [Lachnospiraceae bacterium]
MRLGALETGGTKMVCAIGDEKGNVYEKVIFETKTPGETVPELIAFFKERKIDALGIGCFGPIDLDEESETYGYITSTPKPGWGNYNFLGAFKEALSCPVGFDTDVNASVLGEVTFGQAKGKKCVIYLTIGTGIGAGIYIEGKLLHGMLHPEAGHVLIQRRKEDTYKGKCPYHENCLEGLASGPALEERWGQKANLLHEKQEVWDLEAWYVAQALTGYVLTLSPDMIILGGGVMYQRQLFPMIRKYVTDILNGYVKTKELADMDNYIVPESLEGNQGILGCFELAKNSGNFFKDML